MKFNKLFDTPPAIPSDSGKEIYEWQYLNENGELVSDSKDMYAYIQSFKRMTEYKELIDENGNIDLLGANSRGVYADVSPIEAYGADIDSYIAALAQTVKEAIAAEQAAKVKKNTSATGEVASESGQINKEGEQAKADKLIKKENKNNEK